MDDTFVKRLSAAVGAAWLTVVIAAIFVTFSWVIYLVIMHAQPAFVLTLWGGGELTWGTVQTVGIWFYGVLKICIILGLFGTIFLTLWARRLKQA